MLKKPNFFVIGKSQVGKTTIAKKIAHLANYTHVSAGAWARAKFATDDRQELSERSFAALADDPDISLRAITQKYDVPAGGLVIEGIRNPRDFCALFDPRKDAVISIETPNVEAASAFESSGLAAIDTILSFHESLGSTSDRTFRFILGCGQSHGNKNVFAFADSDVAWSTVANCAREVLDNHLTTASHSLTVPTAVHADIDIIQGDVQSKYLHDLNPAFNNNWEKCEIFSISSYPGCEPQFQCKIDGKYVFSALPARAFSHKLFFWYDSEAVPDDELTYSLCPRGAMAVISHKGLAGPVEVFFKKSKRWVSGQYVLTLDWIDDNLNAHLIALATGQLAVMPSHKVRFGAPLDNSPMPDYKKLRTEF